MLMGACMKNGCYQEEDAEIWYWNGQYHREDGPAYIESDGTQAWYLHGEQHRIGGPAVTWSDGREDWYVNGQRHRTDGPCNRLCGRCR